MEAWRHGTLGSRAEILERYFFYFRFDITTAAFLPLLLQPFFERLMPHVTQETPMHLLMEELECN
jgi:hypothetical protein